MALAGALVDKGRCISNQALPQRVEGTTQMTPVATAWFKCRLSLPKGTEPADPTASDRRRYVRQPELLVGHRDKDGHPIDIKGKDRIEVDSRQFGNLHFEVVGDPEPLRKKRRVIGWVLTLERADEHPMTAAI